MAIAAIDQGAGMRIKIAVQAREPTIAKTRNPRIEADDDLEYCTLVARP